MAITVGGTSITFNDATTQSTAGLTSAVTSIATNNGLTGGTITTSGTIGLDVYNGTNALYTTYAVGTTILASQYTGSGAPSGVNGSATVWTPTGSSGVYMNIGSNNPGGSAAALSGTWRLRGYYSMPCGQGWLMTRTA